MKTNSVLTAALLCSAVFAHADVEVTMAQLRRIGFLPQDKADLRPEDKLDIKRRNPFAERKKVVAARPTETVETEEAKLRFYFDKQKVSGLMKLGDKTIVTLGRLSLEAGQIVPPLIPNQTHILRVLKVTDKELEIGWVEDTVSGLDPAVPRKIRKRIDLSAKVDVLIASEEANGETAQTYTMDDTGKVVTPQRGVFPNPSEILENLPPGSDLNPSSALNEQERGDLESMENTPTPEPPREPEGEKTPDDVPPGGDSAAAPEESPEDKVQDDPDLAADPAPQTAGGSQPAGPPAK